MALVWFVFAKSIRCALSAVETPQGPTHRGECDTAFCLPRGSWGRLCSALEFGKNYFFTLHSQDLCPEHGATTAEYHQKLQKELRLDTDEYRHVHSAVLNQFDTLLRKYSHAFRLPGALLRRIRGSEHHINTGKASPCYRPTYRMSPSKLQAVRNQINAMLKQDIIRPCKSPWCSGNNCTS